MNLSTINYSKNQQHWLKNIFVYRKWICVYIHLLFSIIGLMIGHNERILMNYFIPQRFNVNLVVDVSYDVF